jgi:hypothetical protein
MGFSENKLAAFVRSLTTSATALLSVSKETDLRVSERLGYVTSGAHAPGYCVHKFSSSFNRFFRPREIIIGMGN